MSFYCEKEMPSKHKQKSLFYKTTDLSPAASTKKNVQKNTGKNALLTLLQKGKKSKFLSNIKPMLCSLIREPFEDPEYLYEVKLDGYRLIAYVQNGQVVLASRSGLNYTKKYPAIESQLSQLKFDVIVDGELVALNKEGHPDFDALQKNNGENPLAFYLFDILWCQGYNLMDLQLTQRKEILSQAIPFNDVIRFSENFDQGISLFELIKNQNMEGIVAKKRDSKYQPGARNKDWLKLPTEKRQEFVIGGWTESDTSPFAALIFGYYENGKLLYQGHAGGGYKAKQKKKIFEKIKPLEIKKSPFANKVDTDRKAHFIKPELVANIKFATYTASGKIRKPAIFLGFRDDKKPQQVVKEKVLPLEENPIEVKEISSKSEWPILEKETITSEDSIIIYGKKVQLTNVEKELWNGITKADLIAYYHSVSHYILPYLVNRAESLHIKHISPTVPGLYIKDMENHQPAWAEIFSTPRKHRKEGKRNMIDYLVCSDEATLLYMINLGCIDVNPWTSRVSNYLQPDYVIIDLDPSDEDFKKVIETALAAKKVFDQLKIKVYPKTSGRTGMHFYLPCTGFTFPETRTIAINICKKINQMLPDITTIENLTSKRGDKLFIDYNQNDEADTVAAPYSVRPWKVPCVSTPLEWKEINGKLDQKQFTIHNILDRIKTKGDLFEGIMDEKIRKKNSSVLKKLLRG